MKYILVVCVLLFGCHPVKITDSITPPRKQVRKAVERVNYLQETYPDLFDNDTLIQIKTRIETDTLVLNNVLIDTIIERKKAVNDTIKIEGEGVTSYIYVNNTKTVTKYKIKTKLDSFTVYHTDTIEVETKIYVPRVEPCIFKWWWLVCGVLIVLLFTFFKRIVSFIEEFFN